VGLKEAQVQSYSPDCVNAPSYEGTLGPPGEYDSLFVCGGDAALCQITLTTCCLFTSTSCMEVGVLTAAAVPKLLQMRCFVLYSRALTQGEISCQVCYVNTIIG